MGRRNQDIDNDCNPDKIDGQFTPEQEAQIDWHARRIAQAMRRSNRHRAHELVDEGIDQLSIDDKPEFLKSPVSDDQFGLPIRTLGMLDSKGVITIEDFLETDRRDLLAIDNFGYETLIEVYCKLLHFAINRLIATEKQVKALRGVK
jgi:DNA-directed RNA polymerase alpha subunit